MRALEFGERDCARIFHAILSPPVRPSKDGVNARRFGLRSSSGFCLDLQAGAITYRA